MDGVQLADHQFPPVGVGKFLKIWGALRLRPVQ